MRSAEQFDSVQRLIATGMNDCAIARETGIPRPTVRDWRCRRHVLRARPNTSPCGAILVDSSMTSPRSRHVAMYWACISATDAFHEAAASGVFVSPSTRNIRRSLSAAARQ